RRLEFDVLLVNRRGVHDEFRVLADILGGMTRVNLCAKFLQVLRAAVWRQVGAVDVVPLLQQKPRQTAHPAAANSDEVYLPGSGTEEINQLLSVNHIVPKVGPGAPRRRPQPAGA